MDSNTFLGPYMKALEAQRQLLHKAQSRRGQRLHNRESRDEAYNTFMMGYLSTVMQSRQHEIHSSFVPPAYAPCATSIVDLTPIFIKDLQLETHHRGRFLTLRTITPPNRMSAIMAITEDEKDDVVLLMIYQQEDEEVRRATDFFGQGTVLIVKEPYFKATSDGRYGLRVDHLSDIVWTKHDDSMVPAKWRSRMLKVKASVQALKKKGNDAVAQKRYHEAIDFYSEGIDHENVTEEELAMLKRNRALAYLKTGQFDAALLDTGFPSFGAQPNNKALFRAADTLYNLERYDECCQTLELFCSAFSNDSDGPTALARARDRITEQTTGIYPFKRMQALARTMRPPQLNHATFTGPVEVRQTASKGRGLFATQAIKAGDLLLCEKAFGYAYAESEGSVVNRDTSKISLLMNIETNQGFLGTQADLLTKLVRKLWCNPSRAPAFKTLFHGQYESPSTPFVDDKPIVDTFLVERIMTLNVFGCPDSSIGIWKDTMMAASRKEDSVHHSSGFWIKASYINHSCRSNAHRSFIGDMMVVRATRDLEPGAEILFTYRPAKKLENVFEHWGFRCECTICLDTKTTKPATTKQRQQIHKRLERDFDLALNHPDTIRNIQRTLDALQKTYPQPTSAVPRVKIFDPQLALTRFLIQDKKYMDALVHGKSALESLGFVVTGFEASDVEFRVVTWGHFLDHVVEAFQHVRSAFRASGAEKKAIQAEGYAKVAYRIAVGEDETYDPSYDQKIIKHFTIG
ncbi:hypothetical protein EJ05DRAFT_328868 [Pseudovirgaria hyperparasitica]|uniref:SET domain-containing protein n=1 Tax=Pseudovirgaria hyperparasitica TaxID=470096 RepID=A0A6A6WA13_9PEZI|nr:uncharacterized protein EJ05DRAFT_328868 [Pseudovirgaria hyperparasitica]KAF2758999.1 hypothetical protein EJ05DRAFT_328868 [Pseudovirgaria hyperparasitica]